jgi:hypothetical protein
MRRRAYTREECIDAARTWQQTTGAAPTKNQWNPARLRMDGRKLIQRARAHQASIQRYEAGGYPSEITIRKIFGSWNGFMEACGWEPRRTGRPVIHAVPEPPTTPTLEQVRRRVGLERRGRAPAFGRAALASVVRGVIAAEQAGDDQALVGTLLEGAAQLLAWADHLAARKAAAS